MSLNLAVILRESARRDPDRVAIILDSFKFTYGQLDALSNQAASSLKAGGLRKGDRVGVMLPNVPQFPIAYFAILKAGGVVVPMNVLLKAPEVSYYMGDSGARYLVAWDDFAGEAVKGLANLKPVTTFVALRPGNAETPEGTRNFMGGDPQFDAEATEGDDTAVIAFVKERAAAYKYPRTVQFVDSLPKGATGKILKKELKAQLEAAART